MNEAAFNRARLEIQGLPTNLVIEQDITLA